MLTGAGLLVVGVCTEPAWKVTNHLPISTVKERYSVPLGNVGAVSAVTST